MLSTPSTTNTTSLTNATSTMSRKRPQRAPFVTWTLLLMLPMALCALASPAVAQVLYGSIVGNVVDETRGNLPGATVTILHNESGQSRETVSDSMGAYRFTAVQPGTYTVTVKLEGFRPFTRQDVAVTLNSVARVDVPLQVGQLSEAVTVSAERPLLQTDRAEVRSELQSSQLVNLPVSLNRNYQYLFRVLPGLHAASGGALGTLESVARARLQRQRREPQLQQHPHRRGQHDQHLAAARSGLRACARVARYRQHRHEQLRCGAGSRGRIGHQRADQERHEQLHGSAFEYYTNEQLRTQNYFAPPGTPKGDWQYNQYGGTLGGPIIHNKLFYFGSYEGTRDRQTLTRTVSVPTAALRRGDLSASPTPIYDPFTGNPNGSGRTPFAGNIIPADRIDPTARQLLALLPLPNLATTAETNNYFVQAPFVLNRWTLDTKVNWSANEKLNLFGRFSVLDFFTENGTNFGKELQGQPLGSSNPGTGEREHLQRVGRRDLHDQANAPDGRPRRLRPHEHRRRAVGYRREQRAGFPPPPRHERPERL